MTQAAMTDAELQARSIEMTEKLASLTVAKVAVIKGKTYERALTIGGVEYAYTGHSKYLLGLIGKRGAEYTVVSQPKGRVIGKKDAMVFSIVGHAGRDCGAFYLYTQEDGTLAIKTI